jgi:decaprenylphospho-beta-D-erythro-pentofuranosid-2-ulose 2-reductase
MPTVLILGATSDIGVAIARKFASAHYDIQLAARHPDQLIPLQTDLQIRYDIRCTTHQFDALLFDTHAPFYEGLNPHPDVTVYVIGYMTDNEKALTHWSEALRTIHTNYTGAVSILNLIAADYASKKSGAIIGVSSVAGERGRQSNFIYGSAKAGFTAYLSGLRNRLFHDSVHVMTVLPGFVYTKMTEHLSLAPLLTAQPEQVAEAVYNGLKAKRNTIYVKGLWRWIMLIITSIPEPVFKKRKL